MKITHLVVGVSLLWVSVAYAVPCNNEPGVQFAMNYQTCGQAITACEGAAGVSDPKTGKTGYCPGEWRDGATQATGMGLWADCIGPLAHGKNPALGGVTVTPALEAAAKSCNGWRPAFCAQTPKPKGCK